MNANFNIPPNDTKFKDFQPVIRKFSSNFSNLEGPRQNTARGTVA